MHELRILTYTSVAAPGFCEGDLARLGVQSRTNNAIEGVSGLLLFNGRCFSQTVEGERVAIDDLLARLLRDDRHSQVQVRIDERAAERVFANWDMHVIVLPHSREEAIAIVEARLLDEGSQRKRDAVRSTLDLCFS